MHVNQVTLVGVIGSEIEYRDEKDAAVCSFTVGTEIDREMTWHRVRAWGYRAKLCRRNLRKGLQVQVIGPLTYIKSGGRMRAEIRALVIEPMGSLPANISKEQ